MMTPDRANEILNLTSDVKGLEGFKISDVGSLRDHMTSDEVYYVKQVWDTMPGSASFVSALQKIANGDTGMNESNDEIKEMVDEATNKRQAELDRFLKLAGLNESDGRFAEIFAEGEELEEENLNEYAIDAFKIIHLGHYQDPDFGKRGSDKVWGVVDADGVLYAFWGRHGKTMRYIKLGYGEYAAAEKKFGSKLAKGYKEISHGALGWVVPGVKEFLSTALDKDEVSNIGDTYLKNSVEEDLDPVAMDLDDYEAKGPEGSFEYNPSTGEVTSEIDFESGVIGDEAPEDLPEDASDNIYWKDALDSGQPIEDAGSVFKCGDAVCFWHGQEGARAQQALARAARDVEPVEETEQAEYDYGYEDKRPKRYNMSVHDYKGRAETSGGKLRRVNDYGDNPMVAEDEAQDIVFDGRNRKDVIELLNRNGFETGEGLNGKLTVNIDGTDKGIFKDDVISIIDNKVTIKKPSYVTGKDVKETQRLQHLSGMNINEDDEEMQLDYIASLIEQGFTSGHYPTWSVTIHEDNIDDLMLEEIARLVREGFTSGIGPNWDLEHEYEEVDPEPTDSDADDYAHANDAPDTRRQEESIEEDLGRLQHLSGMQIAEDDIESEEITEAANVWDDAWHAWESRGWTPEKIASHYTLDVKQVIQKLANLTDRPNRPPTKADDLFRNLKEGVEIEEDVMDELEESLMSEYQDMVIIDK